MSSSNYNQEDQGKQNPKGQQPAPQNVGQNPHPKPGQMDEVPDQSNLQQQSLDEQKKENVRSPEKGLIRQLPEAKAARAKPT